MEIGCNAAERAIIEVLGVSGPASTIMVTPEFVERVAPKILDRLILDGFFVTNLDTDRDRDGMVDIIKNIILREDDYNLPLTAGQKSAAKIAGQIFNALDNSGHLARSAGD